MVNEPSDDAAWNRSEAGGPEADITGATRAGSTGQNEEVIEDAHPDADVALAGLRSDMAAQQIRRRRSSIDRSRAEAGVASCLVSSLHTAVSLVLMDGATLAGTVVEVGRDYVCIETGSSPTWAALVAIAAVRTPIDPGVATSAIYTIQSGLTDVIEDLILSESDVVVAVQGGQSTAGTPLSTGELLTMRCGGAYEVILLSKITSIAKSPPARSVSARR